MKGNKKLAILLALLLAFSSLSVNIGISFAEEPAVSEPEPPKEEAPKREEPKPEAPKEEAPKQEAPKPEPSKEEAPKQEAPKPEPSKEEAPKQEEPEPEAPKEEAPKQEDPKPEAPKEEAPKQEEPEPEAPKEEIPEQEEPSEQEQPSKPEGDAQQPPEESTEMQEPVVLPLDPEENPEQDADAEPTPSPEPTPEPEDEPRFEMRSRSKAWSDLHLDSNGLRIPSNGMPIPLIYQYDYKKTVCTWEGDSKSVASSGCGAASASMVIAYVHKNYDQTPYTLFYRAADNGWYRGEGLDYEAIRSLLSSNGVDSRLMGTSSEGIISALKENRPIIIKMGPGTFTDDGHYIVLRGLDEDGNVLVNDPNSSSRSQRSYSAQHIARECKSQYMIVVYTRPDNVSVQVKEPEPTPEPEKESIEEVQENSTANMSDEPENIQEEAVAEEAAASEDGVFEEAYLAAVNYKSVNLRQEPVDGLIVTSVKEGTVLRVIGEVQADGRVWCAVEYQGSKLFIRGDMLTIDGVEMTMEEYDEQTVAEPVSEVEPVAEAEEVPEAADSEPEVASVPEVPASEDGVFEGSYLAAVNYKRVNLRDLPSSDNTKSAVITSVPEGCTLCVVGEEADEDGRVWCAVLYQKQKLYIRGDMLTALN